MTGQPLDVIPMWALYFLTVLAMLATMEMGYRLTRARQRRQSRHTDQICRKIKVPRQRGTLARLLPCEYILSQKDRQASAIL